MKRRTEGISLVRSITSGGDSTAQMAAEVKALSKEERESILQEAQLPIFIPTDHALAMKADLSLPWNKLRILRRYVLLEVIKIIHPRTFDTIQGGSSLSTSPSQVRLSRGRWLILSVVMT